MITFSWQITPEDVWPGIVQRQINAIERDIVKLCEALATEIQAWMKANHAWQNITGAAEAGLYAELLHIAGEFAGVLLSHGDSVPHAIWLEVAHQGRFSILAPALDTFGPRLLKGVREIVRKHSS